MNLIRKAGLIIVAAFVVTVSAWAQMGRGGMGPQAPQMPFGAFKPDIGSGAQYDMTAKMGAMTVAYALVGKEDVEGSTGYWMEIRMTGAKLPGETVMKQLMVLSGTNPTIKRMIMQAGGRPPIEMPMGFMDMMKNQPQAQQTKTGEFGEKLGSESVTVPAGTFMCDHYRGKDQANKVEFWVATQVAPFGIVKVTGTDLNMVLTKVLTGETSHIKGEPQKMNFEMPKF